MATSAVSGRELSKSFLPVASVLKAFPMAAGQAGSTGAGGEGTSETATFSEALKAARRPVRESAEKTEAKPEKAAEAEKETASESEAETEKEAARVREKPAAPARAADRKRSKEGAEKSSRRSSKADDAHRDHGPREDDPVGVQASPQAAAQAPAATEDEPGEEKPVSTGDQPTGEAGPEAVVATNTTVTSATATDPTAQAAAVSAQITPVVTPQVAAPATPAPVAATDATPNTQVAAATVQPQTTKKTQAAGADKAEKKTVDGKVAKTEGAERAFAKKELRQAANPDDDAAEQQEGGDDSAGANKPQHAQNMSAFGKAVAKIATGNETADVTASAAPVMPTAQSPAMQVMQGALAETLATPPRAEAPIEHDAAKPVAGTSAISGSTGTNSAAAAEESADAAAPAQQLPASESDQTFEQVVMGLRGKLDPRSGKAEIRLDPPNLGTLHVSVQLSNGSLTAQFQSSSDVVRDLLKSNMEKLKSVLQSQGVTVDKLAVESPSDKVVTPATRMPNSGSPNNDGRSAGQYTRDPQSGQKKTPGSGSFARLWRDTTSAADAPIDVVG